MCIIDTVENQINQSKIRSANVLTQVLYYMHNWGKHNSIFSFAHHHHQYHWRGCRRRRAIDVPATVVWVDVY